VAGKGLSVFQDAWVPVIAFILSNLFLEVVLLALEDNNFYNHITGICIPSKTHTIINNCLFIVKTNILKTLTYAHKDGL